MKKISILLMALLLVSCATKMEKMQTEYFKDFQAQVLNLSQRIEVLESKMRRDAAKSTEIDEKFERLEKKLGDIEKDLSKIKSHPLLEEGQVVSLKEVPNTNVITIKPQDNVGERPQPKLEAETQPELKVKQDEQVMEKPVPAPSKEMAKEVTEKKEERADNPILSLYNKGYEMYNSSKYPQAISIFREFLQKYPNDALADNAQYWIAESYYAQKMFDKAIAEFKKVEKYPDGNKIADAYLKIVYSYTELGKKKEAEKWKSLLLKKYKDSEAAKKLK